MTYLTRNFTLEEFLCRCERCEYSKSVVVHPKLLTACQAIRDLEGVPLRISSGCRCAYRNQQTPGAAKKSWHIPRLLDGDKESVLHAADITFSAPTLRTPQNTIRLFSRAVLQLPKGLGIYHGRIHLDYRPGPYKRWEDVSWSWANFSVV